MWWMFLRPILHGSCITLEGLVQSSWSRPETKPQKIRFSQGIRLRQWMWHQQLLKVPLHCIYYDLVFVCVSRSFLLNRIQHKCVSFCAQTTKVLKGLEYVSYWLNYLTFDQGKTNLTIWKKCHRWNHSRCKWTKKWKLVLWHINL